MKKTLPVGKLPPALLEQVLNVLQQNDSRIVLGPGTGLDCAVLDMGDRLLVCKTDPITFATQEIGWYAVQVCANDIVTTGASPRWFMSTLLLPEKKTTQEQVMQITREIQRACQGLGVNVIGGHTEITSGLDRPIVVGCMLGEVARDRLISPQGAQIGDRILLSKGVPVEAVSILGREFPSQLQKAFSPQEIQQAANFLMEPGISIVNEARLACQQGGVHAMHDPTEGGLEAALWEVSEASRKVLEVNLQNVVVNSLAERMCKYMGINPLAAIASGALLMVVAADHADIVRQTCQAANIPCMEIGCVVGEGVGVWCKDGGDRSLLPRPISDEVARLYE